MVGLAVLAGNLHRIGLVLQRAERARLKRERAKRERAALRLAAERRRRGNDGQPTSPERGQPAVRPLGENAP